MEVLSLGRNLLVLGGLLSLAIFFLSLGGHLRRSQRLLEGARAGFYGLAAVVGGSAACLLYAFYAGVYNADCVYNNSERFLPAFFKLAGLWAGLDGSLLFWTFLLALFAAVAALQHRWSSRHPEGRRLEPCVYMVLSAIALFFVVVTWNENPFKTLTLDQRLRLSDFHRVPIDESGNLLDGGGLNQQLVNYWFVIHPPTLYLGFVGWTVPFAFGIAGLLAGELGEYWRRTVRRWSLVAWIFLTSGIILGGLWAYRQLGWGGYWAWDPVENASLLPWLTATAFVHSILVMERRDLLKGWSVFLLILTFYLTIVGTWMTRSGVVNSVHAFAGGAIGTWFLVFLFVLAGFSIFVLAYGWRALRGTDRIESLMSREAVSFTNNLVLVTMTVVVMVLSFLPKITHDWFASMRTEEDGVPYNQILTPFFALLLFLTAVGPGLGWVKTPGAMLRRNFRGPVVATVVFMLLLYAYFFWRGLIGEWKDVFIPKGRTLREILIPNPGAQHPTALYPTGLLLGLSFFIFATVIADFLRGVAARVRNSGENPLAALIRFALRNNRRYGGYTVHLGIAILAAGIVVSSMFKVKEELVLKLGESIRVGSYVVTPVSESVNETPLPGEPYAKVEVLFRVAKAATPSLPVAHGESAPKDAMGARSGAGAKDASGTKGDPGMPSAATAQRETPLETVVELRPERRFYPKKNQWISEVTIHRRLFEDIYIYFSGRDAQGHIGVAVFLNPLMIFIYLGWFTMIGGAVFAALPLGAGKKPRSP